jgi:hypothetical protein
MNDLLKLNDILLILSKMSKGTKYYSYTSFEFENFTEYMFYSYDMDKFLKKRKEIFENQMFYQEGVNEKIIWDINNEIAIEKISRRLNNIILKSIRPEIPVLQIFINDMFFTFLKQITK